MYIGNTATIRDSSIYGGTAEKGAGIAVASTNAITVSIVNTTITTNFGPASDQGKGMGLYLESSNAGTVVTLNNVTVANNGPGSRPVACTGKAI